MHNHSITTWENPTKHVQRFELAIGPGATPEEFVLEPGKTADVLSKYDDAIRTVRDGIVVAGLAPMLVPKGRKPVPVHEAIAKAAHLGDVERRLVEATGTSAGSASLDAVAALQSQNDTLKQQNVDLQGQMAALAAKVEALMGALAPTAKEQPKGSGGQGKAQQPLPPQGQPSAEPSKS